MTVVFAFLCLLLLPVIAEDSTRGGTRRRNDFVVNVDAFGAVGDGVADDTQAFLGAWQQACSSPKSVFLVPEGQRYRVNATKFVGPCTDTIVIQIDGTVVAPDDPQSWDPRDQRAWLAFHNLSMAAFQGNGVIDGSGSKWWAASCKKNKTNPCRAAPTAFTIESSSSIRVKGLTIQNGQQINFAVSRSDSVRVTGLKVTSPEDSPNTDGIHISESTKVLLQNCKIGTGDDCISIVSASSSIRMKNIYCGPGHGISIGSIGKNNSTGRVEKGGSGFVRSVRYQRVTMENVSNPIIIDQFYCDSPTACQNQTSAVEISRIMFQDITGTSRTKEAIKFACSDTVPCTDIYLKDINLQGEDAKVETFCNSVSGSQLGFVQPSAECLSASNSSTTTIREGEEVWATENHLSTIISDEEPPGFTNS
ncbi:hypothetical protein M569_06969 [Genlisea aurea]|uniref:Polygalacturonase n=1 Tax=Genlisea aurea TaxID=192259 RepID=S8CKS9_9LAMI|nr:hypothetical protein M569_06969 [Genlisea aurea]